MPDLQHRPLDNDIAELLGVCRDCRIKHPTLQRDTHSGRYVETGKAKAEEKESVAAAKARRRNERKATKPSRLDRALAGEFTPVSRSRAVA